VLDRLVEIFSQVGHWGYLILFAATTLESAAFLGLFVPGETLTVVAGAIASAEVLSLSETIAVAAAGAALGDSIGYELGRRLGRDWLLSQGRRVGFRRRMLRRVDSLFARHGGKAVIVARFIGFLRALAPFAAGSSRMPYRSFLLCNVVGAVVWAVAFVSLGYAVGASWSVAERWVGRASLVVGAIVFATTIAWLRAHRARRRRA
jgi:membrane protein DedA with SNARE-associated domain